MRLATVAPGPGRKLARTGWAVARSRRSRLAGWIWLSTKGYSGRIRPASAIAAIMRSGRMPLASLGSENGKWRSFGPLKTPEIRPFTALSEDRLDGKLARE